MQAAGLAWVLYRDRLPETAREKLRAALALGVEGMLRHKVDVSYTNIFLMRLANCILIGESTGRPDLVQRGRAWLDEWLADTRAWGIHEYSSPTYYGVDLSVPGLAAPLKLSVDLRTEKRLAIEGADLAAQTGILNVNGRDLGAALLP
jgi:hypothetical protein